MPLSAWLWASGFVMSQDFVFFKAQQLDIVFIIIIIISTVFFVSKIFVSEGNIIFQISPVFFFDVIFGFFKARHINAFICIVLPMRAFFSSKHGSRDNNILISTVSLAKDTGFFKVPPPSSRNDYDREKRAKIVCLRVLS